MVKAKSDFRGYEEELRTMNRGMAVTAFGEPTKVQSILGFAWTKKRAESRLSETELLELENQRAAMRNQELHHDNGSQGMSSKDQSLHAN